MWCSKDQCFDSDRVIGGGQHTLCPDDVTFINGITACRMQSVTNDHGSHEALSELAPSHLRSSVIANNSVAGHFLTSTL